MVLWRKNQWWRRPTSNRVNIGQFASGRWNGRVLRYRIICSPLPHIEFAGEGKEGYIHHIWTGVHWRLWNTWGEILVKTKIFPVKIFLLTLLEPVFFAVPWQLNRWPCHWLTHWLLHIVEKQYHRALWESMKVGQIGPTFLVPWKIGLFLGSGHEYTQIRDGRGRSAPPSLIRLNIEIFLANTKLLLISLP